MYLLYRRHKDTKTMRHLTDEHKAKLSRSVKRTKSFFSDERKEQIKAKQRNTIATKEAILKIWEIVTRNETIQEMIIKEINKYNKDNNNK